MKNNSVTRVSLLVTIDECVFYSEGKMFDVRKENPTFF